MRDTGSGICRMVARPAGSVISLSTIVSVCSVENFAASVQLANVHFVGLYDPDVRIGPSTRLVERVR